MKNKRKSTITVDLPENFFGEKLNTKKRKSRLEAALLRYDINSFDDRLKRLKYLNTLFPKGISLISSIETVIIFDEVKMSFINGEFVSTLMLAQAFIERRLQSFYEFLGYGKIAQRGLKSILVHAKKNNIIIDFFINKIDLLRKKRNSLSHLKKPDYEFNLDRRIYNWIRTNNRNPYLEVLENDAKESIQLMYAVAITDFDKIKPV
jgi:hypothetical protein